MCLSAGEALPVELYRRWVETFGVEILDGIGSAEMFHIYITNRLGDVKPGSLGRVVEGYEAEVVDARGVRVAAGEMGTLRVKGDSAALCYWQAHEKSKATFAGDWCTTGDQFHVDEEGYYWYHGRTDDMLKVSGIYVAPAEIENCLLGHDAVLEARGRRPRRGRRPHQAQSLRRPARRPRPVRPARASAQGLRQDAPRALQVPALGRVRRLAPQERPRQDRPQGAEARRRAVITPATPPVSNRR